jgi:stearoyl-CoA desaturase (delta-9 desaturase)
MTTQPRVLTAASAPQILPQATKPLARKLLPGLGLLVAHLVPFVLLFTGMRRADWIAFVILYAMVNTALGLALHRYFAHHSFKTSRAFQFFLGWLAATFFGDPVGFAGKHRLHHKYSDRPEDVHSPRQGMWHCWIGSLLDDGRDEPELLRVARDWTRFPELMWLHRSYYVPALTLASALWLTGGIRMFAVYWVAFLIGLHGPSAVNYFCHLGRNRRFDTGDDSTNRFSLALLLFGEGWHNNHHRYPPSARSGFAWYEIDMHYYTIKLWEKCGLVWDVKTFPAWLGAQAIASSAPGFIATQDKPAQALRSVQTPRSVPAGGR